MQVSVEQLAITVQLVQARSWRVVQAVLSFSPGAQVEQEAQLVPSQNLSFVQAVHTWSVAVVQVSAAQLPIAAQVAQSRSCPPAHAVAS